MSATGLVTDAIKTAQASNYSSLCLYMTLLKALDLQAATSVGAATFSVDLSVQAGDVLVLEQGLASQETVTVQSVTGSGPYTVTPTTPLTKSHAIHSKISHVPLNSSTVHELAVTRVASSWTTPVGAPAGRIVTSAAAITVPAGAGNVVGAVALFSASTSGTYYDATAVNAQDLTAGGTYQPAWQEDCT